MGTEAFLSSRVCCRLLGKATYGLVKTSCVQVKSSLFLRFLSYINSE